MIAPDVLSDRRESNVGRRGSAQERGGSGQAVVSPYADTMTGRVSHSEVLKQQLHDSLPIH